MQNYKKTFVSLVAISLISILSTSVWAKASLTKVRVGQSDSKTRIVFDIKKNHRFEIAKWHNPPRIVVDFYQAKNKVSFKEKKFLDSRLGKIRIKNQKKRTRVVLDLRKNFDYSYFTLGKNKTGAERVVIDIAQRLEKKKPIKLVRKNTPKHSTKQFKKTKVAPLIKLTKATKNSQQVGIARKIATKTSTKPMVELTHDKELVVAIDAGHGGKDTGAIGHNNTQEKVVVLQLAKKLKKYIDAQPGMRAILTRDKDVFIQLHERVRIAHKNKADIFLSLHADAFVDKTVRGGSVYVLSTKGASSVMARVLAKAENASLKGLALKGRDSDVAFILSDLTREANIRASKKLGKAVLGEMGLSVKLHRSSVQSANFGVLKSIDIPSLLIETAFVSNPHEAKKLRSDRFQTKMAKSIVRGLSKFAKRNAKKPRWGESLYVKYKVKRGDTLSEIAYTYGVSVKELKKLNRIKRANQLFIGKRLKIPVSEEVIASL